MKTFSDILCLVARTFTDEREKRFLDRFITLSFYRN